ncbi:unnamed protein product, partial [Rotaria socialis]
DPRCTQVWANIIADAFEKITELSPLSQIYQTSRHLGYNN